MGIRNLTVYITGDPTNLKNALREAATEVDRFVDSTQRKSSASGGIFSGLGLSADQAKAVVLGAGVAIVGALGAAVKSAIEFDSAMRNVNSIAHETEGQFQATAQAVLDMSKSVPQSATTLAKGLYEINSSGFSGAQGLQVLQAAAVAASAGLSDTDTAAQAISGALNAYGLSAASAKDVSDTLFQTVNLGVINFDQLAKNLGDFVGTAAAAKVPLGDAAAALATMTKNGVTANEAATSLNQVFTQLLRPGKELAAQLKDLGYESGEQALATDGLYTVMTNLGKATGSSAGTLIRLFQSVEAGRGAFALLAGEGKAYADIQGQIADKTKVTGATQRAFSEQMKAAGAQFQLFVNQIQDVGISLGEQLLPVLINVMKSLQSMGAEALPYVQAGFRAISPIAEQVWSILGNVVSILGTLQAAAAPVEKALASIAGAALIATLHTFLSVLETITGFLSQHAAVVAAVGVVYAATLLPSVAQLTVMFNKLILTPVVLFLNSILTGAAGAGGALKALSGALTVSNVAIAGFAAAAYLYVSNMQRVNDASEKAQKTIDGFVDSSTNFDVSKAGDQLQNLTQVALESARTMKPYSDLLGQLKADAIGAGAAFGIGGGLADEIALAGETGGKAADAIGKLNDQVKNFKMNAHAISDFTGLSDDQINKIAQMQNIDLSKPFASSASARQQIIDYIKDVKTQDGITTKAIISNAALDAKAMEALEKSVKKVVDAATSAFDKDTDVLAQFDPVGDANKVADAQKRLDEARRNRNESQAKANESYAKKNTTSGAATLRNEQQLARDRKNIADAEERAATNRSKSARSHLTDDQAVQRARQKLADDEAVQAARAADSAGKKIAGPTQVSDNSVVDAERALAEARAQQAKGSLQARYRDAVTLSKKFVQDVNTAIQRGLDPEIVSKLLQEGPAKAEPALQAILRDHSGNMIKLVNTSEAQISQLSGFVAEQARIAAIAMNAPTDQYTRDLKTAMNIAALEAAAGGKATAAQLAKNLKLPAKEVKRIAEEFGVTLARDVQNAVDKNGPVNVKAKVSLYEQIYGDDRSKAITDHRAAVNSSLAKKKSKAFATGGPVTGPPGIDVIPAMLTANEYVLPVAAVQHYGVGFMEALRARSLPRRGFADGGLVGRDGSWASRVIEVGGPRVVAVPVPIQTSSSVDNSQTINVDRVVTEGPGGMQRWSGQQRRYSPTRGVS